MTAQLNPVLLGDEGRCIASFGPSLALRYVVGLVVLCIVYYGAAKVFPLLIAPLVRKFGIKHHDISYSSFKPYLLASLARHSTPSAHSLNEVSNTLDKNDASSKMAEASLNEEMLLAWTRLVTKFFQYWVLSVGISLLVPYLTRSVGV